VKDNSGKDIGFSVGGFLLGLAIGILFGYIIIADFDPVGSQAALIILLPIIILLVSMVHSFMAMKGGHNLELILIVLFDILCVLILFGIMLASL